MDLNEIYNMPTSPERIFNLRLEDSEVICIKDKGAEANHRLLNKCRGFLFTDDVDGNTQYIMLEINLYRKPYRSSAWCNLGETDEYDGTNDYVLTPFIMNDQLCIYLVEVEDQPPINNIKKKKTYKAK